VVGLNLGSTFMVSIALRKKKTKIVFKGTSI